MKNLITAFTSFTLIALSTSRAEIVNMAPAEDAVSLFDGKTLAQWKPKKGDEAFWSVIDGTISGGGLEKKVPRNVWLISEKNYENFEFTFEVKFTNGGGSGLKNSGIQIRSLPINNSVCGYQIDAGPSKDGANLNGGLGYWGSIWDENRRGALVNAENQDQLIASIKHFDEWNQYKVICNGTSIKTWINGILANDYIETNPKIAADGIIALQVHAGEKFLVHFKNLAVKELPATAGSPKWTDEGILKGHVKKRNKAILKPAK